MPRDASGNYTLPAGNPVVSETLITSVWANTTMSDLGSEVTDSLSRSGKGGMTSALSLVDAGWFFRDENTTGVRREAAADVRLQVTGTDMLQAEKTNAIVLARNNPQLRLDPVVVLLNPIQDGAKGNGTTDDATALTTTDAKTGLKFLQPGTYKVSSNITLNGDWMFASGALLAPDAGVTITFNGAVFAGEYPIFGTAGSVVLSTTSKTGTIFAEWWSAADDNTRLDAFFASVNSKIGVLGPRTYNVTAPRNPTLSNCRITGVPGASVISTSTVDAVILASPTNVEIDHIKFESTLVRAVLATKGVLWVQNTSVKDLYIHDCTFTAAQSDQAGLNVHVNESAALTNTCDGLRIENNIFESIGSTAITIMNRSDNANRYTFMRRVRVNGNLFKDCGLVGTVGFGCSLDGSGEDFAMNHNTVDNCLSIGLENTAWRNGEIIGNRFRNLGTRSCQALAMSGSTPVAGDKASRVVVANNSTDDTPIAQSYLADAEEYVIENNHLVSSVDGPCVLFRNNNNCVLRDNTFKGIGSARYGIIFEATSGKTCRYNRSYNDTFINNSASFPALGFSGTDADFNEVHNPTLIQAAGGTAVSQVSNAINNLVWRANDSITGILGLNYRPVAFTADADLTPAIREYSAETIRVTDPSTFLTTTRNVILPPFKKIFNVTNATAQSLVFKASTGTGVTVPAGQNRAVTFDGTNFTTVLD